MKQMCEHHELMLVRAKKLLNDDVFYSFQDAMEGAFRAHFLHHCTRCREVTEIGKPKEVKL